MEPPLHYWRYFVALENDLAKTARFVEIAQANQSTYSIEYARLLLAAGSEVDVLCKVICEQHQLALPDRPTITHHRTAIMGKLPQLAELKVLLPTYGRELLPWSDWKTQDSPDWWKAYNSVKHQRHEHFGLATQANALLSVAAAFVLVAHLCHRELREKRAQPWPELMTLDPALSPALGRNLVPGHLIPGLQPP